MEWSSRLILAQASSGLSDFMRQVPVGLILMFCGTGVVLVVVVLLIVRARMQRREHPHRERPVVPVSAATKSAAPMGSEAAAEGDLPDLDMLVSRPASVSKSPPPPSSSAPARTTRSGTFQVKLDSGGAAQAVEVVTILRDVVDGGLIIQMGDRAYRDLTDDETFRDRFLKVMRELSPVVAQATARKPPTAPLHKPPSADSPAAETRTAPAPTSEAATLRDLLVDEDALEDEDRDEPPVVEAPRRAAAPPPEDGDNVPGDLPRYSLDDEPQIVKKRAGLLGRTKTEFVPVPELNLAEAIEAYLQHKLVRSG
ncbi:MAG: hypothetical protein K8J31_22435, partial [Anaerolineae bacterium]|nr:hypothetical protein [Anaerolineae bacterium]